MLPVVCLDRRLDIVQRPRGTVDVIFVADAGLPFTLRRRQFPVRPAFAMTINKAQGQTMQRVGVLLDEPVFSHAQLYVASSRSGDPRDIKFCV